MAKRKTICRLDIGSARLRSAGSRRQNAVIAFKRLDGATASRSNRRRSIDEFNRRCDGIEELFAAQKIKHKEVATSVSGHSVIIKKINLPQMTPEELEESIQWEGAIYSIRYQRREYRCSNSQYRIDASWTNGRTFGGGEERYGRRLHVCHYEAGLQPTVVDVDDCCPKHVRNQLRSTSVRDGRTYECWFVCHQYKCAREWGFNLHP